MMAVHGRRPRYRDIWFAIGSLSIMVIPSIMVNSTFPGANRMFLELELPMLPENPYLKALIYSVLLAEVFHLMWFVPRLFARKREGLKSEPED